MKNPVRLYNNVIRLGLKKNSDSYKAYQTITEAIIETAKEFQKEGYEKPLVEFTFGSTDFEKNIPKLLKEYSESIEISIGTVCKKEEAQMLIEWAKELRSISAFAPHYSKEIKELFENSNVSYIPGLRSIDEYKRFIKDHETLKSQQEIKCKIYPCTKGDEEDLLNAISGPYPELRQKENRERVFTGLKTIEKDTLSAKTYMIKTPFEYSQIREIFLKDKELKFIIQKPSLDAIDLIKHIKENQPEAYITATGMSELGDSELELLEAGADSLGSSSAVKNAISILNEANPEEVKASIKKELKRIYSTLELKQKEASNK